VLNIWGIQMGNRIDLGCTEVELPAGYAKARRAASIARVRQWEAENSDRYLAGRRARYRARNERTCKGVGDETCILLVTGTGRQRCNYHAYLQDLAMRRARRDQKKAAS